MVHMENISKKHKLKILVTMAFVLFIGMILWLSKSGLSDGGFLPSVEIEEDQMEIISDSTVDSMDSSVDESVVTVDTSARTEYQSDSTAKWMHSRGFTSEYNMHFNQREFLENQAKNGDMLAAQLLGNQRLGTPKGDKYLTDAARWGSIQALLFLSSSSELVAEGRLIEQRNNQQSEQDQYEYSLRALEYLFVAEIRGDNYVARNNIAGLMNRISYTQEDIAQSCIQAISRYNDLELSRLAEGLPPFDNSSPPANVSSTAYSKLCGSP